MTAARREWSEYWPLVIFLPEAEDEDAFQGFGAVVLFCCWVLLLKKVRASPEGQVFFANQFFSSAYKEKRKNITMYSENTSLLQSSKKANCEPQMFGELIFKHREKLLLFIKKKSHFPL